MDKRTIAPLRIAKARRRNDRPISRRFTFQTAWPKKATRTQKLTAAAYAARLNSVLSSWYSGPSALSCLSAEGWPCAGYSGLVNPDSGVLVCWSEPQTRKCRQSLGRLLGRAAVIRAEYERIERIGSSERGRINIDPRGKIKPAA
jgi:hypothetical protein